MLHKAIEQAQNLSDGDLATLDSWLHEEQARRAVSGDAQPIPVPAGRQVVSEQRAGKITYRQEKRTCGTATCRCAKGDLHGPYWYAYWREDKRLRSKYIGKSR